MDKDKLEQLEMQIALMVLGGQKIIGHGAQVSNSANDGDTEQMARQWERCKEVVGIMNKTVKKVEGLGFIKPTAVCNCPEA